VLTARGGTPRARSTSLCARGMLCARAGAYISDGTSMNIPACGMSVYIYV